MRANPSAEKFHPSRLFQRVRAPNGFANPFCFGGGGSGMAPALEDAVARIFAWDYMGAAEYEFGAAAKCLGFMWEHREELLSETIVVGDTEWYLLVHKAHLQEATALWTKIVDGAHELKEPASLQDLKIVGWFDFENGWFVSRSKELRNNLRTFLKTGKLPAEEPADG